MDSPNLDSSAPSWKNWAASCAASPARIVRPENEAQAVDLVREALEEETSIRVAGAGHSFSSLVPTDGMLIDTELLRGITELDQDRKRARMKAGTRLNTLGEPLWDAGFALHNQGDIDRQSIAGAVATATHGSGIQLGSFSSQLTWARLINGEGQIVEVDESDQQTLRALQTSLGTFGMLLEVEIQLVDRYLLEEQITYPLWAETMSSWDSDVRENRHYSIQWCPYADSGEVFGLTPPNEGTLANRSFTKKYRLLSPNETHVPRPGTRIDHSYKIYPGEYEVPYREMEYFVDARYGLEATSAVQELLLRQFPEERHPIEVH